MTCIVALKDEGRVVMGADSAGVGGYSRSNRMDPKIYRVGSMLIGFTTSFRMGQLLGYSLTLPHHHADVPIEKYMATSFITAVRDCLKAVFRRSLPVLETRALIKKGKRIASTTLKGRA